MWIQRIDIAENERGLLFRNENFVRVLGPGRYRFLQLAPWLRVRVDRYDLTNPIFEHALAEFLVKTHPELREGVFQVVELGDHEVGLQIVDGKLTGIVPPATRMIYWRACTTCGSRSRTSPWTSPCPRSASAASVTCARGTS